METSILNSTKKILNIAAEYTAFDQDILMCINTSLATLTQIGIGPEEGFSIEDASANWEDFVASDPRLTPIQTYVYLKSRMIFDPPATSFAIDAMEKQILEHEWRLNTFRENLIPLPDVEVEIDE